MDRTRFTGELMIMIDTQFLFLHIYLDTNMHIINTHLLHAGCDKIGEKGEANREGKGSINGDGDDIKGLLMH